MPIESSRTQKVAAAQKHHQRYTSTGIFEWVRTLTVSLPRTTAATPRRPWEAIRIKSHPSRFGGFDNRLIDLFMLDVKRIADDAR